jgi:hypothetical protein
MARKGAKVANKDRGKKAVPVSCSSRATSQVGSIPTPASPVLVKSSLAEDSDLVEGSDMDNASP